MEAASALPLASQAAQATLALADLLARTAAVAILPTSPRICSAPLWTSSESEGRSNFAPTDALTRGSMRQVGSRLVMQSLGHR